MDHCAFTVRACATVFPPAPSEPVELPELAAPFRPALAAPVAEPDVNERPTLRPGVHS
jgi:hypothetical protein